MTDTLNDTDRGELELILPDLVSGQSTPKTQLGIVKMKILMKKGGAAFVETVQKVLVDVISETVKKALFPF